MMTLEPKFIGGKISAPPSKSEAHRALICAALSDAKTYVKCGSVCNDVKATADALCALGAKIIYEDGVFTVFPTEKTAECVAGDCAASGSTLRFVLPVAAALGTKCEFLLDDSLKKRPSAELYDALSQGGAHIEAGDSVLLSGKFEGGNYEISGDISSQYASGL
ncbi:MAG: 3-phosphoshikimate 1-carboxyvinyltransferase, partial [Clostridiales bacterium]|nr:3-phosphoshikimate 1-carboxyvinyltransferase [Clostridiales bacterium]